MKKYFFVLILLFFLTGIALVLYLKEMPDPGKLEKLQLTDLTGIPLEYGKLINVTTHAAYEGWSQLWFEDENNIIRMVRVQFHMNRIHERVLVIPRN
ncbi:MAG: hypothetical protein KAS18_05360 [Calditrichia bacterium]|nr:hypothetical protein [Calditrichia bacterium]